MRVNLLALPSLTSVYVVLIVSVLYGTMFLLTAHSHLLFWPLLVGALVLSVGLVAVGPWWRIWWGKLVRGEGRCPAIAGTLALHAGGAGLKRTPEFHVERGDGGLASFGSWTRACVVCGGRTAARLERTLGAEATAADAEAALVHELHHLARRDHLWIGYTRAALLSGVAVMLPATVAIVIGSMVFESTVNQVLEFLPPWWEWSTRRSLVQLGVMAAPGADPGLMTPYQLTVLSSLFGALPVMLLSLVLLVGVWRRLLRVREHYADAGAARQLGAVAPLMRAVISLAPPGRDGGGRGGQRGRLLRPVYALVARNHPTLQQRLACLLDPAEVFGTPARVGMQTGVFLLIVGLFVHGAAPSLTGGAPLVPVVPAGFLLVSLYCYLRLATGRHRLRDTVLVGALAILPSALFSALLLAALWALILLLPAAFESGMASANQALEAAGRGTDQGPFGPLGLLVIMTVLNVLLVLAQFLLVVVPATLVLALAGRILSWYPYSTGRRTVRPLIHLALWGMAAVLTLEVLPTLTHLVSLQLAEVFSLGHFLLAAVLAAALITAVVTFTLLDRHHARRCASCATAIPGRFTPVRRCPACGEAQNGWLLADYRVEPG